MAPRRTADFQSKIEWPLTCASEIPKAFDPQVVQAIQISDATSGVRRPLRRGMSMRVNKWSCLFLCAAAVIGGSCFTQNTEVAYTGGAYPEHAKPGEVWCLVTTPATFKTVSEEYTCQPASCRFEKIPAVYVMESE